MHSQAALVQEAVPLAGEELVEIRPRPPRARLFLFLLGAAVASSFVVLVEPAPVDLALTGLFVFAVLLGKLAFRRGQIPALALLVGFAAANVIPLVNSVDPGRAIWYAGVTLYLMASWVLFAGVGAKYGKRAVSAVLNGYIVAGTISAAAGILAYAGPLARFDVLMVAGRPRGLFKDPNVFGPFLVPLAVLALDRLLNRRGTRSSLWIAVFGLATAGVFVSFSRACWANYAVAVSLYVAIAIVRGRLSPSTVAHAALALLVGAGGLYWASQIPQVEGMLAIRWGSGGLQRYDRDRFRTQHQALATAIEKPLGIGPGQSEEVFQYSVHSTYLRVLAENGVLGFCALFAFIALSVFRSFRLALLRVVTDPLPAVVAASLAGHLVNSAVIDTLHWRHGWLLLALAWAGPFQTRAAALGRSARNGGQTC